MKMRLVVVVAMSIASVLFVLAIISTPNSVTAWSGASALEDSIIQATPLVTHHIYLPLIILAPCLRAPTLTSPTNGAHLSTLVPTLVYWRGTAPVTQTIITIADNAAFNSPMAYATTGGSLGPFDLKLFDNLLPATTYYWRVRDQCGAIYSPYSTVFNFTTGSGGVILPAPTLKSPVSGTLGLMKPVTLTWYSVAGAAGYQIYYSRVGSGGNTLIETGGTSYVLNYLNPNAQYEWWVVAYNSYAYGTPSSRWRFTTGTFAAMSQLASPTFEEGVVTTRQDAIQRTSRR